MSKNKRTRTAKHRSTSPIIRHRSDQSSSGDGVSTAPIRHSSISSLPSEASSASSFDDSSASSPSASSINIPTLSWPSPPVLVRKGLFVDSVFCSSVGFFLIFSPHLVAELLMRRSSPTDGVHWHLLRCIGAQLLAISTLAWRCSSVFQHDEHSQRAVQSSCILLRLLASLLSAFVIAHNRAMNPELFEPQMIRILIWLCFSNFAFYLFLFIISGGCPMVETHTEHSQWGRIFYHFDHIMAIAIGTGWTTAPLWILHKQVLIQLDPTHRFCGQLIGVNFAASHLIGAHAPFWNRRSNRAKAVETRILMGLLIMAAQIWSQMAYNEHWSRKHLLGISVFTSWTSLALCYRIYLFWVNWMESSVLEEIRDENGRFVGENEQQ